MWLLMLLFVIVILLCYRCQSQKHHQEHYSIENPNEIFRYLYYSIDNPYLL